MCNRNYIVVGAYIEPDILCHIDVVIRVCTEMVVLRRSYRASAHARIEVMILCSRFRAGVGFVAEAECVHGRWFAIAVLV